MRDGLVGLAFLFLGEEFASLGVVESKLSDEHYLARLHNIHNLMPLEKRSVISLADISSSADFDHERWHFFESIEAASDWFDRFDEKPKNTLVSISGKGKPQ